MELAILEEEDTHTLVALKGQLDMEGVGKVDVRFSAATVARGKPTLVELSGVEFIASLGMGMLVACARALGRKGVPMILVNPQLLVEKARKTARLQEILPMVHGLEQARARLRPQPA